IPIHIVSGRGLVGTSVAAPVMRNDPTAVLGKEQHLPVPHVGAQRPAVRERHDRSRSPVLVINGGPILCSDRAHGFRSFVCLLFARCCWDSQSSRRTAPSRASSPAVSDRSSSTDPKYVAAGSTITRRLSFMAARNCLAISSMGRRSGPATS